MINNVTNVSDWLRLNELKSWEVRTKDGDNAVVFRTSKDATDETNMSNFMRNMELSRGGRYVIYACGDDLGSTKKGRFREEFENLDNVHSQIGNAPIMGTIPDGYISRDEVNSILEKERLNLKLERIKTEVEDLREENRRLNEPIKKFMANISPIIAPVVSGLLGKITPSTAQIGTVGGKFNDDFHDDEITNEDDMRLRNALEAWSNSDSDFILLIEKISNMASSSNPFYGQAKEMLLKM